MYPSLAGLKIQKILKGYPVLISTNYGPPCYLKGNGKTIAVIEYKLSDYSPIEIIQDLERTYVHSYHKPLELILVSVREDGDETYFGVFCS